MNASALQLSCLLLEDVAKEGAAVDAEVAATLVSKVSAIAAATSKQV